jgi:hypothetical protein
MESSPRLASFVFVVLAAVAGAALGGCSDDPGPQSPGGVPTVDSNSATGKANVTGSVGNLALNARGAIAFYETRTLDGGMKIRTTTIELGDGTRTCGAISTGSQAGTVVDFEVFGDGRDTYDVVASADKPTRGQATAGLNQLDSGHGVLDEDATSGRVVIDAVTLLPASGPPTISGHFTDVQLKDGAIQGTFEAVLCNPPTN